MGYMTYTDEMKKFIEENYKDISTAELVDKFNLHFGTEASLYAIKKYKENHGLRNGRVGGNTPMKYTEEMHAFMKEYVPGHTHKEIQAEFNRRFVEVHISLGRVKSYIKNHGLNTGFTGRFQKGNIPPNKGQKMSADMYEKCKATMFKKGQEPVNHRQVGSERITKDGYIEVKIAEPNKWRLKHLVIWEEANGPVPPKHCIFFMDNDRTNVSLENLRVIPRNQLLIMNGRRGFNGHDKDSNEVALTAARLTEKIEQIKRGNANGKDR